MTNWERTANNDYTLKNLCIPPFELPKDLFKWLKKAVMDAKKENEKYNKSLIGYIKEEYVIKKWSKEFESFVIQSVSHPYLQSVLKDLVILSENRPFYLDSLWVNFQKRYEFNPLHTHSGLFSFIIFVNIPYDLDKETKYFPTNSEQSHTSKLVFVNNKFDGSFHEHLINVDKSFEGKMFLFRAKQTHMVYPFYTSDKYRITVSGNLKLKV